MFVPLITLAVVPLAALAAPTFKRQSSTVTNDGSSLNGQTFDFVIAGGGLGGLVVAARLAQDSRVLVIEAGHSQEGNDAVTDASKYAAYFGDDSQVDFDWKYQTTEGKVVRAGKGLGGSTLINGMAWSKPHSFQLDALETVGNPGVNWAALQPYMQKVEGYHAPSSDQIAAGVTYDASCHGSDGPVQVQFGTTPADLEHHLNQTAAGFGMPYATDLTCGNPAGLGPMAHNNVDNRRYDTYYAYTAGAQLPNLTILTDALVGKVLFNTGGATPVASGLEVQTQQGSKITVNAGKDVIIAAGSIGTPLILQHSGVGPKSLLEQNNIAVIADLPVGLNLIDQTTTSTYWSISGSQGNGQIVLFPRFEDIFQGDNVGRAKDMLNNNLDSYVQEAVSAGTISSADGLKKVLEIQRDWILNQGAGVSENYDWTSDTQLGYDSWFLLPFTRGSVKIKDNNAYGGQYDLDPRFFSNEFDTLATGATQWFTKRMSTGTPLNSQVSGGSGDMPSSDDLDEWANWSKGNYRSNWHPIGTVPMMSQDLGGCVDSNHAVYGVKGLRVVDASNIPFQVSAHLMTVLYGLAGRAADVIHANPSSNPDPTTTTTTSPTTPTTPTSTAATTPTPTGGGKLHPNGNTAKCLTGTGYGNDAPVYIQDCQDGNVLQNWEVQQGGTAGQVRLAGSNSCLDGTDHAWDGMAAKTYQCYDNFDPQRWLYNGKSIQLVNQNMCLDLTDGSDANGQVMQYWTCFSNSWQQTWTR